MSGAAENQEVDRGAPEIGEESDLLQPAAPSASDVRGAQIQSAASAGQLSELTRIARENPRNEAQSVAKAERLVAMNREVAASCFYKLKRYDKKNKCDVFIEGPSIRLSEIFCSVWKNTYRGSYVTDIGATHVTARAEFIDLENLTFKYATVKRRITTATGLRYGDDMITTTAQAACSVAERNATLAGIPRSFVNIVFATAKKIAVGEAKSIAERRQKMVEEFAKISVSIDQILKYVSRAELAEITMDDMELLLGTYTAIHEGMATVDETFSGSMKDAAAKMPIVQLNLRYAEAKARLSMEEIIKLDIELKKKGVNFAHPKTMSYDQMVEGVLIIQNWRG